VGQALSHADSALMPIFSQALRESVPVLVPAMPGQGVGAVWCARYASARRLSKKDEYNATLATTTFATTTGNAWMINP